MFRLARFLQTRRAFLSQYREERCFVSSSSLNTMSNVRLETQQGNRTQPRQGFLHVPSKNNRGSGITRESPWLPLETCRYFSNETSTRQSPRATAAAAGGGGRGRRTTTDEQTMKQIHQRAKAWLNSPPGEFTPEDWYTIQGDVEILLQQRDNTGQCIDLVFRLLDRCATEQGIIKTLDRAAWVDARLLKKVMQNWFYVFRQATTGTTKNGAAFCAHHNPVVMVDRMDHYCKFFVQVRWSSIVAYYIVASFNAHIKASNSSSTSSPSRSSSSSTLKNNPNQDRIPSHGLDFAPAILERVMVEWKRRDNDDAKPVPELLQAVAHACTARSIPPHLRIRAAKIVDGLVMKVIHDLQQSPDLQLFASAINAWALTRSVDGARKAHKRLGQMWEAHRIHHGGNGQQQQQQHVEDSRLVEEDSQLQKDDNDSQNNGGNVTAPGWVWVNALRSAINGWSWSKSDNTLQRVEVLLVQGTNFIECGAIPSDVSTLPIWNAALQACAVVASREGAALATKIIDVVVQGEVESDRITLYWYIASLVNGGEVEKGEKRLIEIIESESVDDAENFLAMVLHGWARSHAPDKHRRAQQLVERVRKLTEGKLRLSSSSYNALLDCLATSPGRNAYYASKALELLSEMKQEALRGNNRSASPDLKSYTLVVRCLANIGEGRKAKGLYDELVRRYKETKSSRLRPDSVIFNDALTAFSNSKDKNALSDAQEFFQKNLKRHSTGYLPEGPDSYSFSTLVSCIAMAGGEGMIPIERAKLASELLEQLHNLYEKEGKKWWQPSTAMYNAVMECWANAGCPGDCALTMNRMMKDHKNGNRMAAPDIQSFNILLKSLSSSKLAESSKKADEVLSQIKSLHKDKILSSGPNMETYSTLIHCHVLCGRLDRAHEVLREVEKEYEMDNLDGPPDEKMYDMVARAQEGGLLGV